MRVILFSIIVLVMSTGCKKDPVTETSSDFVISVFREFANGQTSMEIERAVLEDQVEGPNVYFNVNDADLVLRLGRNAKPGTKLGANIVFRNAIDPMKVVGTYTFPADRDKVDIELFEYTANGFSRTSIPAEGTLIMKYDARLKTFSGNVEQLKYQIPFRADYVFQLVSMKFDGVSY